MHAIVLPEQVVEGLFSTVITCVYTPNVVPDGERGVAGCSVVVLEGMRSWMHWRMFVAGETSGHNSPVYPSMKRFHVLEHFWCLK